VVICTYKNDMKKRERIIASILLCIISFSNILTPVAYAAPLVKFHAKKPAVNFQAASLVPNSSVVQPDQGSVLGVSTSLVTDGTVPLTLDGENGDSANIRIAPRMEELPKQVYKTDEDVMLSVINPDNEPFSTKVTDGKGDTVPVPVTEDNSGTTTSIDFSSSDSLHPGRYTVAITDSHGQITTQDFTWGVLAMNFDKSEYHPGDTGDISFGVLNDNGDMVCDADLKLQVTNKGLGIDDMLSTTTVASSSAQIAVSPQCQSHDFSLEPDYYAHYKFGSVGTYQLQLTATTNGQSHTISDSIQVTNDIPFDVQRVSATRIYPPNTYPMLFNITANRDFTGTVTETVPDSFTIIPATQSAVAAEGETGSVSSYDNMKTVYLNNNDPAANLQQAITASDSAGLVMPFTGSYPITQGFGAQQTDPSLQAFYTQFGLAGHDGVDFGVPMFTPLYAVDNGTVIWSGPGDYGVTIIIKHGWGESYYGHLSSTVAKVGQSVTKGELIGYSGESGDATGPHLHFGMRPDNSDMTNGYYGKIDPLPYLPFGHEPQSIASLIPATASQIVGQQVLSSGVVLGASDSGGAQAVSEIPIPSSQPTVQPSVTASPTLIPTSASGSAVPTETIESSATPTPQPSLEQTDNATPAANESFSVLDKEIQLDEALSTSTQTEKVKVITWQVSLKKGQQITLGYAYQAPRVSPEFYLLGPMKFYEGGSNRIVFQEQRAWEIASDDVGTEWFYQPTANQPWNGYGWQHRQKIDISHLKVGLPGIDSQSVANQSTNVHILNWQHTVGNYPNRLLVVAFSVNNTTASEAASVTYGTQSLTPLTSILNSGAGDIEMWYLVNPNVGTNTIAITLGAANTAIDGQAISLYNVNQTTPFGTPNDISQYPSAIKPVSNTVTTTANELVLDTMWTSSGSGDTFTPNSGQTAIWTGSAFGIGSYKPSSGTSTTMAWTLGTADTFADIAVGINPEMGTAISPVSQSYTPMFMDSGGDANNTNGGTNILAANGEGFYDRDSGTPTVDCTVSETGPCSYKFSATASGVETAVSKNNVLKDAGSRISMYFNYATLPTTGGSDKDALVAIFTNNDSTFIADLVNVTNAGKLCINNTTTCSTDTIVANNWYHLSVSYTLTSTTIQSVNVYLNGKLEVSENNAQTWAAKGSQALVFGALDTGASSDNVVVHVDDIYVDNGTDLSDPGAIHVTAKLPISNGALNQFATNGSASGTTCSPTGTHCEYVNERPINTTDYLSSTTDNQSENFTIQSASQGDVNITNDAIVGDEAWAYMSSNATCSTGTADITNNGIYSAITLPTSNAMIATASAMTTYPSGNQAIGLESCSAGTNRTINYYETGLQIAYLTAQKSNVTFINSGGDATENTTNELGFWTGNNFSTGTGATSVDCTTSETGPCSLELNAGTGSTALDNGIGSMASPSGRISFYFKTSALPTGATILHFFNINTGIAFDTAPIELNSSGNVGCGNGTIFGTSVLATNTWYRLSMGYQVTGITITYNIYLNGVLQLSCPTISLLGSTTPNNFSFGSDVASTIVHIDDVYADNGSDESDPGNIHVTAKRPYTNGTTNQFSTNGSSSGYGSGNAGYVNERPINTSDYLTGTHGQTDEYSIESASQGDVNISTYYPIADQVWVNAELTSASTCSTPAIINNGTTTPIELSATTYSVFTSIYSNTSYPSGNTDVGMTACSGGSDTSINLAGAGMQIAYETSDPNSLTNFPVLINATDSSLIGNTQTTGNDIAFTDSTGETLLPYEIESYKNSTGAVTAWVNIAALSADNDTILYMYYGNPSATSLANAPNTWNSNYKGVWHFSNSTGTGLGLNDSTTNGFTLTNVGSVTGNASQIGEGAFFNGSSDLTATSNNIFNPGTASFSVYAWINTTQNNGLEPIMDHTNSSSDGWEFDIGDAEGGTCNAAGYVCFLDGTDQVGQNAGILNNSWYQVAFVKTGTNVIFYVNGVAIGTSTGVLSTIPSEATVEQIGTDGAGNTFDNDIDEIEYSNTALSPGWIQTEYNNQGSPSTFETVGTVETDAYAPTLSQMLRHGEFFGTQGSESGTRQPFTW
jgi:murein DD-endopeptidase MepM/ murein hydrolase activator NlpD